MVCYYIDLIIPQMRSSVLTGCASQYSYQRAVLLVGMNSLSPNVSVFTHFRLQNLSRYEINPRGFHCFGVTLVYCG
jgi:hypothetical protein